MGKDMVQMSQKELRRVHVIQKVIERSLTQVEAGIKLDLSERQIRRLVLRVRREGNEGIIHRLRDRPSKRKIPQKLWQEIIRLYRTSYYDFGPTFACEKLYERNEIKISNESLRKKLIGEGLWSKRRKARTPHKWRERKHALGEMVQLDGSKHFWFEGRGSKCVLMGYIDDATSKKYGQFYEYEGTLPAFAGLKLYIKQKGIPLSVYVDKHSTYRGAGKQTIADELADRFNLSQFERACKEMSIKVIHAHSAQAKGRIERSFKTDQDRLIKELRLAGISTIKEANKFLKTYWPKHNKRFSVQPISPVDLHRPLPKHVDLDKILCVKTERVVRNDGTIAHHKKLYQIMDRKGPRKVTVEEHIDGRMRIAYNNRYLRYSPITVRPDLNVVANVKTKPHRITWRPLMEHPWKKPSYMKRISQSKPETLTAV
jgi:hypothetical protein